MRFFLSCPTSVAPLRWLLPWFFVGYLLAGHRGAAVPLASRVWCCALSACLVTCLWYGLCSCSVHNRDVAFPTLVGFAFSLRAVSLPQADAVGFGLRWSARLPPFSRVGAAPSTCVPLLWPGCVGFLPPCYFSSVFLRDVVTLSGH